MKKIHYVEVQAEINGKKSSVKKIEFAEQKKRNEFMGTIDKVPCVRVVGFGNGIWEND